MIDILALETFITAARLGSISEAATLLHLTQPAVSKRIQLLEQQLGVLLFDRINRKIQLTDHGKKLAESGQNILLDLKNLEASLQDNNDTVGGKLSLAVSHHVGLHRLPKYLKAFSKQYPYVELDLSFTDSEIACERVESGVVELAVVTLPPQPINKLEMVSLWEDPLCFVAAKGKFDLNKQIGLAELAKHPAILPTEKTYTGRLILNAFARKKLIPHIAMSTNYLETIKMMVSIGLAWSVLPSSMLDSSLDELTSNIKISRELGYVKHHQRTLSHAAQAFIDVIRQ